MKYLILLVLPLSAFSQRWLPKIGVYSRVQQSYEVKGEFYHAPMILAGCGCLSTMNAAKIQGGPFDCRVNEAGDIYCKNYCDENATCNTYNGTDWVTANCCYYYYGRKEEQCILPLPPISYIKITRQVFQA